MKTNEKWIYVLDSDSLGKIRLDDTPSGWDIQQVSISRSMKYLGLFQAYKETLRFFGDGREYIQKVYERNGSEHEITIDIYEYVAKPTDKFEPFFSGVIDLSTYKNEEDKFVEVDINDSSFSTKIVSRDDIRIDLSAIESIDGETIPAADEVTVNLHQREILNVAQYELNEEVATVESDASGTVAFTSEGFSLPIRIVTSDIDNIVDPWNKIIDDANCYWFGPADVDVTVTVNGTIKGTIGIPPTVALPSFTIRILFRVYTDDTCTTIDFDTSPLQTFDINGIGPEQEIDITIDQQFTNIPAGEVIALIAVATVGDSTLEKFTAEFTEIDLDITQKEWFDSTTAQGLLMFEVGQQLTRIITGKDKFVSEFLGRPDLGYEDYGEGSLVSMHASGQIRKFPDSKSSITLTDFFQSESAMWNLAMGVEYDNVSQPFLRIEQLDHFFNGNVIASLHSVTKMTKSFAREWVYSDLKVGYDKAATELTNGLEEYNNKFTWATFIKSVKNLFDPISKIRADGYGIEKLRRLSFETNPTEDTREDNDNFAVVVSEDGPDSEGNTKYKSVKDEEYDTVENIFSPESAYNLDLSPGRNLRRNGTKIRAGLEKYLDKEIKFQHAEQRSNMVTKRTGQAETIDENANIDVSTLNEPLWIPDVYTCEFVLDRDLYKSILKNPGGIMKLSTGTLEDTTNYNYGWILNIEYNPETDKSTGEFLRVNLNNTNIILVDPDGNSPDPIPPIPEPTIFGALESTLPMILAGPDPVPEVSNAYNFTGIEDVTISGVPTFERTQTFVYRGNVANKDGNDNCILWTNRDDGGSSKGIDIIIVNDGTSGNSNKLLIVMVNSIGNWLRVDTDAIFLPSSGIREIEIIYDGSSVASGFTVNVDGSPESLTTVLDTLTATIIDNTGAKIGKRFGGASEGGGVLKNSEFTIDGTNQFGGECTNNGDDTYQDTESAFENDGVVDRDTSTEEEFYINV